VLDLEHRAFSRLVGSRVEFCDDAVEAGAFELLQPATRLGGVARRRGEVQRRRRAAEQAFEPKLAIASFAMRDAAG
jgi:hypothetical protein